jgi:hypothetical protein
MASMVKWGLRGLKVALDQKVVQVLQEIKDLEVLKETGAPQV